MDNIAKQGLDFRGPISAVADQLPLENASEEIPIAENHTREGMVYEAQCQGMASFNEVSIDSILPNLHIPTPISHIGWKPIFPSQTDLMYTLSLSE